jgi:hypothetical protein
MPRAFTETEREYIAKLVSRNYENIEDMCDDDFSEGLNQPIPADERMRRKRIRDKAETAVKDLVRADGAGIIDLNELVEEHSMGMTLALTGDRDYDERYRVGFGSLAEDVNIE